MHDVLLCGVLLMLLAAALLTVITDRLFTAVVYAGVLSTLAAFCYLLLGAPDVALAEAVIGSTLSTVIFLVTLKKYRLFTICVLRRPASRDGTLRRVLDAAVRALQEQDLEAHIVQTVGPVEKLLSRPDCDLVVEERGDGVTVHGEASSRYMQRLRESLDGAGLSGAATLEDSLTDRVSGYKGDEA